MIATTINTAISERTRSSVFDLGFAVAAGGGMAYVGGCSSPANQPAAPDFIGSRAAESLNCEQRDCGRVVGHSTSLSLRRTARTFPVTLSGGRRSMLPTPTTFPSVLTSELNRSRHQYRFARDRASFHETLMC